MQKEKARQSLLSKCYQLYQYSKRLAAESQKQEHRLKRLNSSASSGKRKKSGSKAKENDLVSFIYQQGLRVNQLGGEVEQLREQNDLRTELHEQIREKNRRLLDLFEAAIAGNKPEGKLLLQSVSRHVGKSELQRVKQQLRIN